VRTTDTLIPGLSATGYIAEVIGSDELASTSDSVVRFEFTKYDGRSHWHFPAQRLGADEYGVWFGARRGVLLQRGTEPPISWACDFVVLVPQRGDWVACFNGAGRYPLYIDVTGPVTTQDGVVQAADLDLDVVRLSDGKVQLLDEDEFAEHQLSYGYPGLLTQQAQATAEWLLAAVRQRREPFGTVGARWLADFMAELRASGPQPH
jgi:uncharacterized protein